MADYSDFGSYFHGEISASVANNTATPIPIYKSSSVTAIVLDTNDVVAVTDVVITTDTNSTITIFDGADSSVGAGEIICRVILPPNGGISQSNFGTPYYCQKGTGLQLLQVAGGAAVIQLQVRGFIVRRGA